MPIDSLAVAEPHLAGVEVQVVPTQTQDFVAPAPGQHEEADSRRRVDGRQALGRRRPQHFPEPVELYASQEPLVLLDLEAGYAPAGVASGGTPTPRIRQREHLSNTTGQERSQADWNGLEHTYSLETSRLVETLDRATGPEWT